ncbi:MAG: adenylosuccinate lyase [Parcubacteria group bacterium Gr01-1014_8]|nr:MAG: adenylosuccinate lyase [Parcubacteria group bacterium Gr01-1014_8]
MPLHTLQAITSLDGRYRMLVEDLATHLSEFALHKNRLRVECEYLIALSEEKKVGVRKLTEEEKKTLRSMAENFSLEDAAIVQKIEKEGRNGIPATNHDVKAVEYFLKLKLDETSLKDVREWVHFALTSEDINSVAYGLMLRGALEDVILMTLDDVRGVLEDLANEYASTPMLARTHGQPASPTTFGKEMRVFERRLEKQLKGVGISPILVKFGGATGNWNAHSVAVPDVDWHEFSKRFIESFNKDSAVPLGLNDATTQIEPHDTYAELFDAMRRINVILIDLSEDMWRYISDGWVTQKPNEGEIGSSAMPHKVNPIDFENAEGNLGVANALFNHFSNKLPISRLQRDLSDSTVERVFGSAFAHSLAAYKSLLKGLGKISVNKDALQQALDAHPEVLSEAIQTVLRKEGVEVPYEKLKELTRGKKVTLLDFAKFIAELDISDAVKEKLKQLRPHNYTGLASKIARQK